ncbi:MAG: hydroxymethylpyrimidine/phosphomethylpyrimidine kinase [Planctomycetota bacterium]|nr:MAG: hydroxymethylpyrimidine/phosphomethylpyrimidine kinase [Planctomycetota bacterium]
MLSVAGSDPGGGAGLQLDLKVFAALGADGAAIPAVLTVQGPEGLTRAEPVAAGLVAGALRAVFALGPVQAVKLGALGDAAVVAAVAAHLGAHASVPVVLDPVLSASVAAAGVTLLRPDALPALRQQLLPRVTVLTPNLEEAAALTGRAVSSRPEMERAAAALLELGPRAVLLKGGHREADPEAADLFQERGQEPFWITAPRLAGATHVHGTGCALSSALAVFLASGAAPARAAVRAREVLNAWLRAARAGRLLPTAVPI